MGGGPAGAACAYWLAKAGHDVVVVERKRFPREKTCGDGLTPRSVRQLTDMGLGSVLEGHHRFDGLRSVAFGKTLELAWPATPGYPTHGYVITRKDLDAAVAGRAESAGATLWQGTEASAPLIEAGKVVGAALTDRSSGETREVRARHVVVADGANSRFGRALGTSRDRRYPLGMAIRGYYRSPRHAEPWIESHLDVRNADGDVLPGYGWIFPLGDGRVNVGVGLLSTFSRWKEVNTTHLMDAFVAGAPSTWDLGPHSSCGPPTGGKLPMGFSVGPRAGAGWLLAGDAAGVINPFNGEGIAYAYESGRWAAESVTAALDGSDPGVAAHYQRRLEAEYGLYFKVARAFVHVIGRPQLMRVLVGTGMESRTLMEWILRIMANLLRPDELGPAEAAYRALAAVARVVPERSPHRSALKAIG
ncbi:MAG: geranylgeranyl reductase family protein [Acidimicrobiales bacterium]